MSVPVVALRRLNAAATLIWLALVIPTVWWWRDSVPWVAAMSVWANVASHFASWQAARAEEAAGDDQTQSQASM